MVFDLWMTERRGGRPAVTIAFMDSDEIGSGRECDSSIPLSWTRISVETRSWVSALSARHRIAIRR